MKELDIKLNKHYPGKVVRKDLTKLVKGNAIVPTYVLEYLLGQYCATDDEETIIQGIETVKSIIAKHLVHRDEAEIVKSTIKEKDSHRIIDKVSVSLNESKGVYQASFINLNIKSVLVDSPTIREHPKLLSAGVWCIVNLAFMVSEEKGVSPWIMESIKPIQVSNVELEEYKNARSAFTKDEWINLLMQTIGLDPEQFNFRSKLIQLSRLIPFCENNFNFIELGPKGTGKSHLFTELSPHGILISGGEVSIPNLFINNTTGRMGLVGYWDVVTFDEFAGTTKKGDAGLKDIMQNYMANKTFSRGKDVFGASASMAFVGNTEHSVPYMLKHSDLFEALPQTFHHSAFLDRMHAYLPGWEVSKLRSAMFSNDYGFIVDYLAEVLKELRKEDHINDFRKFFELSPTMTTRDRDGIVKTFSGFIKILYPDGNYTMEQAKEIFEFAMECRKRIKDQLIRIDDTFEQVDFCYTEISSGKIHYIETLENEIHGYATRPKLQPDDDLLLSTTPDAVFESGTDTQPQAGQIIIRDNQTGISYLNIFGKHLAGAQKITLTDPYIRFNHQLKRLLEFCVMLSKIKSSEEETSLHVITWNEEEFRKQSEEALYEIMIIVEEIGINLTYEFKDVHDRSIVADNGWTIVLGRGLDIYEKEEARFSLGEIDQERRRCKNFTITYLKT
ncbi:MAG: BREX system Lon protease-like protein BrxL [Bacteroidales bacterium]|nr:BREX system Lon protease-like protein BrxL [Bacteroidales bacterium]